MPGISDKFSSLEIEEERIFSTNEMKEARGPKQMRN